MPQLLAYIHDTPEHVISANHESVPTCGTFVPWWSCCPKVLGSGQMRMLFTAHYGSSNSIQSYQARPQYSHSIPTVFPLYPAIFPLHSHCIPTVFPHPDISVQVQSVTQNHAKRFPPKRRFISARVHANWKMCMFLYNVERAQAPEAPLVPLHVPSLEWMYTINNMSNTMPSTGLFAYFALLANMWQMITEREDWEEIVHVQWMVHTVHELVWQQALVVPLQTHNPVHQCNNVFVVHLTTQEMLSIRANSIKVREFFYGAISARVHSCFAYCICKCATGGL